MVSPIRLLLVDDRPVVRTGLYGMLASQPDFTIVDEASDGQAAVALAAELAPDVVLMDVRLPALDGVAASEQIRRRRPQTQMLVLTTYNSDGDIVRASAAGATGYLIKDTPREELYQTIRAAARSQAALRPSSATRLVSHMRAPAGEELSAREIEVLAQVARREQ
jgi:DNA-binding NarL/FixJ family response regulator